MMPFHETFYKRQIIVDVISIFSKSGHQLAMVIEQNKSKVYSIRRIINVDKIYTKRMLSTTRGYIYLMCSYKKTHLDCSVSDC